MISRIACPKCGNYDASQKVSAIVTEGTGMFSGGGPSGGVAFAGNRVVPVGGWTTVSGFTQTALAQMLMPPGKPSGVGWYWYIMPFLFALALFWAPVKKKGFLVPMVLSSALACFALSSSSTQAACFFELVLLITYLVYLGMYYGALRNEASGWLEQLEVWSKQMACWDRLYYCYRDDLVYDPEIGSSNQPSQMNTLLWA